MPNKGKPFGTEENPGGMHFDEEAGKKIGGRNMERGSSSLS
jgi:hypothetical protein